MKKFDLDAKLLEFGTGDALPYCIRHSLIGCQVFGSNGSGKSSSMKTWALKLLRADYGFLILSVKPEKETWIEYCQLAGRTEDLIILGEGSEHRFDFLRYLSESKGGTALTGNLLDILTTVIKSADELDGGSHSDPYWEKSLRMLLHCAITLCQLSRGRVTIQALYDILQSTPTIDEQGEDKINPDSSFSKAFELARNKVREQYDDWSATWTEDEKVWFQDRDLLEAAILEKFPNARPLKFIEQYFFETFKTLSQKTKSIILQSASNFLFSLLQDPAFKLFCSGKVTVTPEDSLRGKIILLDLPIKHYHGVGRFCQLLFKYIWQLQVEKRNIYENGRPVCLWSDESAQFLTDYDSSFQSTARSSRVAMVYIAQNIHQYYSALSGTKSQARVASFLGLMNTKLFFSNSDVDTNKYASELIGDAKFIDPSRSITTAEKFSQTDSFTLKDDRLVRPDAFTCLLSGGTSSKYMVEAYIHVQGEQLFPPWNFKKIKFNQNYK